MKKAIALLLLFLVQAYAANMCYQHVRTVSVPVVGVTILPNGEEKGVVGKLQVTVACPGSGQIYVASEPLTQVDTQGVARIAVLVASAIAGKPWTSCDYFFHFITPSVIVGGPSAGIAMTVATYAALTDQKPLPQVAGTGTVGPDAVVGPVGGVYAKMLAAAKKGYKVFVIPKGEEVTTRQIVNTLRTPFGFIQNITTVPVNLVKLGSKLGIKVVPVATVYDALKVWLPKPPAVKKAELKGLPPKVVKVMNEWYNYYMKLYLKYHAMVKGITPQSLEYLRTASRFIELSKEVKDPYQKVNYAFSAAILTERAYWSDMIALRGFSALIQLDNEVKKLLDEANTTIYKNMTYDVNKLDILLTAANRYLKAKYYYSKALNSTSVIDILDYLVYSKYFALASETWTWLLNVVPKGPQTSPEVFMRSSYAMYSAAEGLLGYLLSLKVPLSQRLEVAVGVYKEANTMDPLMKMAASMYLAEMVSYNLHKYYNVSLETMLEKVREASLYDLGLALRNGVYPTVAAIYLNSANSLNGLEALMLTDMAAIHSLTLAQLTSR